VNGENSLRKIPIYGSCTTLKKILPFIVNNVSTSMTAVRPNYSSKNNVKMGSNFIIIKIYNYNLAVNVKIQCFLMACLVRGKGMELETPGSKFHSLLFDEGFWGGM